jgi:hypothetical protein
MTDYGVKFDRPPLVLAKRTVETIQINVIGQKDNVTMRLQDFEVRTDGKSIVNLTPDQALKIAKELTALAHIALRRFV